MELLNKTHQDVVRRDIILKDLTERKVYNLRVIGREVEEQSQIHTQLTPIETVKPKVVNTTIKTQTISSNPKCKNSGEEIQIMNQIDSKHYVVKRKNGGMQIMNSKNILNLEYYQSAK